MSIQTYVNKLADTILYRLQHLDRFTDYIFIPITSISSPTKGVKQTIYYENKPDTHELCDIIHNITQNHDDYNWVSVLLLSCPEHEPTREVRTFNVTSSKNNHE